MHHLLVSTFHRPTADPVTQTEILVILHAGSIFEVVADQLLETFLGLGVSGVQGLEPPNNRLYLAGSQVFGDLMNPALGPLRSLSIPETSELPGVLQGVPKVQNFAVTGNIQVRFQIHSAPSPITTTMVCTPSHPSSCSCAQRWAKMASASPRQVTRKRRTNERRPGEVSTRSSGRTAPRFSLRGIGRPPREVKGEEDFPRRDAAVAASALASPSYSHRRPAPPPPAPAWLSALGYTCRCGIGSNLPDTVLPLPPTAAPRATPPWR